MARAARVLLPLAMLLLPVAMVSLVGANTYEDTFTIYETLLHPSRYKTQVLPMLNQSMTMRVLVDFELLSIVGVDDTMQSFLCNGVVTFYWTDQRVQWEPTQYGGQTVIYPMPADIWRPRVLLINTLDERDIFADDISPVTTYHNGSTIWIPGSLFSTSCSLTLLNFPFDVQNCRIQMLSVGTPSHQLTFVPGVSALPFYTINGEWELLNTSVTTSTLSGDRVDVTYSGFEINFLIRRRPTYYVLTIILPFVLLSFLNSFVFLMPHDSGETIGFGQTVMLSLSVFFSIVGNVLPRSSIVVPHVIVYLFTLYVLSVASVIDCMIILFIDSLDKNEEQHEDNPTGKVSIIFPRLSSVGEMIQKCRFCKTDPLTDKLAKNSISTDQWETDKDDQGKVDDISSQANLRDVTNQLNLDDVMRLEVEKRVKAAIDGKRQPEVKIRHVRSYKWLAGKIAFASFFAFQLTWFSITVWFFVKVAL